MAGICWRFSNSDLVCELGFGTTTEDSTGALDQDGADHAVTSVWWFYGECLRSSGGHEEEGATDSSEEEVT